MIFPSNRVRIMVATKPIELRKGHDNRAVIASLTKTCKMNAVDPQAWLARTRPPSPAPSPSDISKTRPMVGCNGIAPQRCHRHTAYVCPFKLPREVKRLSCALGASGFAKGRADGAIAAIAAVLYEYLGVPA